MADTESTSAAPRGKSPLHAIATIDHASVAPTPSGDKIVITVTISVELDDVAALDLIMRAVGALVRMREFDR